MAVTLVRHTRPDVAKGICYGATDLAVAASFDAEAAKVLQQVPPARVILASPLTRCQRLAAYLARHWTTEVTTAEPFREMDFGAWEGTAWDAIARSDLDAWANDFMNYRGHGGESVAQLETRVRDGLAETPDGAVIVTHQGVIKAAMAICNLGDGWEAETAFGGAVTLPVSAFRAR